MKIRNDEVSTLVGDLEEIYADRVSERGPVRARLWLWRQIGFSLVRLGLQTLYWRIVMIKNYAVIILRGIRRDRAHSRINLAGLVVGLTCSILVGLYVFHELSYDRFHERADRIYRVAQIIHIDDREDHALPAAPILAETLLRDFPEIEDVTMVDKRHNSLVRMDNRTIKEPNVYAADEGFFRIFSFRLLRGDPATALAEPNRVLLTPATAARYFGDNDAMGRTLTINDTPYTVAGLIQAPPDNSHFHFDFVTSLCTDPGLEKDAWFYGFAVIYLTLREGVSPESLEARFPAFVDRYFYQGRPRKGTFKDWELYLQPLTSIHLHSHLHFGEFEPNGHAAYVRIFALIAVFILVIAGINFVNLSTARAVHRAKEVGIRRVIGSRRSQLVARFLGESLIFSLLAMILATGLVLALLPAYRGLTGKDLVPFFLENPGTLPILIGLALAVGILAGIYPALYLSVLSPFKTIAGSRRVSGGGRSPLLGRGLVVFQFAVSIALLIGTGVVFRQLTFMQNKRLGFDREHVLVIKNLYQLEDRASAFKQRLLEFSPVTQVTLASSLPGGNFSKWSCRPEGQSESIVLEMISCDFDFASALQLEMAAGRFFSPEFPSDDSSIVINEETARVLGWSEPLGKRIRFGSEEGIVIGVVRDFHFESLHVPIKKMGIMLEDGSPSLAAVRYRGGDLERVLAHVEQTWLEFSPPLPLETSFLDQDYAGLYNLEMRTQKIAGLFAVLAAAISNLGLFGLATYTAERRRREIGIRKVLGASARSVVILLVRGYTGAVLAASLVAGPAAYLAMVRWLQGFAYRIDMPMEIFGLAVAAALATALLTVAGLSIRAASADPSLSLRCE